MSLITVACAVCGGRQFQLRYPGTIHDPDDEPALYYSSSRERAGYLDIVRCVDCGLVMTNPRDDDATIRRVYGALRDATYEGEDEGRRGTARAFLALVESHRPPPGRLLDIGCATGLFVASAVESGWTAAGVDASAWALARAKERCAQATFVQQPIEDIEFPDASFDVVTMWDVLEHVQAPADILTRIRRWLAPEGRLFLNLPNAGSAMARLMGRHWALLLREHLWYFAPATLARLLRQSGFEMIATRPNTVTFSIKNVLVRAAQYEGMAGRLASRMTRVQWMNRFQVRFPIGEMQVAARPSPDTRRT
jgi:2-polyprenyl-3-methyl-5-hydroxy-6-metoxy-1,4-benzoquinol methylase